MRRALPLLLTLAIACAEQEDWPAECPSPGHPGVRYMHDTWEDRGVCLAIDFACEADELYLQTDADCGCGCITEAACSAFESCISQPL